MIKSLHLVAGFAVAALPLLAGCTTSYQTIDLDDHTHGYHVYCGGQPYASGEDCLDRAQDICGENSSYNVLKQNSPVYAHAQSVWDLTTHDIIITCNPGVAPSVTQPTTVEHIYPNEHAVSVREP